MILFESVKKVTATIFGGLAYAWFALLVLGCDGLLVLNHCLLLFACSGCNIYDAVSKQKDMSWWHRISSVVYSVMTLLLSLALLGLGLGLSVLSATVMMFGGMVRGWQMGWGAGFNVFLKFPSAPLTIPLQRTWMEFLYPHTADMNGLTLVYMFAEQQMLLKAAIYLSDVPEAFESLYEEGLELAKRIRPDLVPQQVFDVWRDTIHAANIRQEQWQQLEMIKNTPHFLALIYLFSIQYKNFIRYLETIFWSLSSPQRKRKHWQQIEMAETILIHNKIPFEPRCDIDRKSKQRQLPTPEELRQIRVKKFTPVPSNNNAQEIHMDIDSESNRHYNLPDCK